MKNKQDPKQSKISRHENAKQKFRFFERSMSAKSLKNRGDIIPIPGQFAIIGNIKQSKQGGSQLPSLKIQQGQFRQKVQQQSLKFTTNLKLITKQRSPSRVSEVLNETVNKKVTEQTSLKKIPRSASSTNIRPYTAVISSQLANDLEGKSSLQQSRAVINAMEYDKKYYIKKQLNQGNSFIVKSRTGIPKHVYGFKSIRLNQDDNNQKKLKIETEHSIRPDARKFSKIPIESRDKFQMKQEQEIIKGETEKGPNFLPVQYYMIEDMKPQELMQKYSMGNNYMVGYSKWQTVEGNFQWKKCRVLGYLKDKERWEIQWLHNGKKKIVGRNNLYFEKEDFSHFQNIIKNAQQFRKKSQVFMKYNWLIDNMKTVTHQIQEPQLNSIIKLLGKFIPSSAQINNLIEEKVQITDGKKNTQKLAQQLINQIKAKFIRANHMVQFNSGLPYNMKYKQQFRGYLPEQYFTPNAANTKFTLTTKHELQSQKEIYSRKSIPEENQQKFISASTQVHCSLQMKKLFEQGQRKFMKQTPLASIHRINIIEYLNKSEYAIKNLKIPSAYDITFSKEQIELPQSQLKFFTFYTNKLYDMNDVNKKLEGSLFQSITRMNSIVCEVEYYVAKEMDPIYLDRKTIGYDNFDDMIGHYRRFLMTVNMRIENMGRQVLLGMIKELTGLLSVSEQLLSGKQQEQMFKVLQKQKSSNRQMKIKVEIQFKGDVLQCTPSKDQVVSALQNYANKLINDFANLSCIRKSYVQELRPGNKMKICQSLYESEQGQISWRPHQELQATREHLLKEISKCGQVYENFMNTIKKVVQRVVSFQGEINRRNWKKCSFNDIEEYRRGIQHCRQFISRLRMLSINSTVIYNNDNNNVSMTTTAASKQKTTTTQQSINTQNRNDNNNKNNIININKQPSPYQQQQQATSNKKQFMQKLNQLQPQTKQIKLSMFMFNLQQIIQKTQTKLFELQKQLYKLLVEKIYKQSQRIEKTLQTIKQKVQEQPTNIKQMIHLEQYINEQAPIELNKSITKMLQLQNKFSLIQTNSIQYKDYYQCHKIILKPLKIRALMSQKLTLIEIQYRKKFGDQLIKEVADLTLEMKQIEDKFFTSTNITTLEQMNASFLSFSKLKERIENALSKSTQVNQYQTAMKWINTSFQRLIEIKDQFMPYYQLITLQKNYNFHINIQLNQPLHTIDAHKISQDVINANQQLITLQNVTFAKNPVILEIVKNVALSYKHFKEKIPLLQILRNPDLRQRHWTSIRQLTGFNDILSDKITFNELQKRDIKRFQKKLIEISHIATRQLIYEKRLNKMKKQWKELKIQTQIIHSSQNASQSQNNSNSPTFNDIRVICNLDEIKSKTENDIFHIQQILASSFIKFLQKDILLWRNHTLYKMYEFIEIWKVLEKQFVPLWKMFSRPAIKNQAPNECQKFKALQKNWRNLTQTIEQQPNVVQLLQTKINQSLKYTVQLIDELKKAVSSFFQKKKQKFSRFGALSQDQLIALYSDSNEDKQVFDQAVRKCLQGIKGVVRNNRRRITMVKTHLDEQIILQEGVQSEVNNEDDDLSPDKIIEDIEKKIKRSLRSCIDEIGEKTAKILQIVLFHQRIIFTREIQSQLMDNEDGPGIKEGYLDALIGLKSKIIQALLNTYDQISDRNKAAQSQIKIQAELNQLINHIEIAQWLYRKNVIETFDFEWVSQIRTYHRSGNYSIHCGLNKTDYGFQITDQQNYIVERNSIRSFCQFSMTNLQRMFSLLSGKVGQGKLSILHYLANIHGRNQLVMNCHQAISYDNIIDSFRMCANGIWVVFNNLNLLSPQVLSVFAQALQLLWANYPTQKSKGYLMLGDKNVMFTTHEINLFATINTNKNNLTQCTKISQKMSTFFRTYSIPSLDVKYILECKLILEGFECLNTSRFFKMIELVDAECEIFYQHQKQQGIQIYGSLNFSKLNFIQKVLKYAKQFKDMMKDKNVEDFLVLQQGLQKAILDITLNLSELKEQIFYKLSNYFDFLPNSTSQTSTKFLHPQSSMTQNQQKLKSEIKKLFTQKKLYSSGNLIEKYLNILKTLKQKHSVIVLGECSTGKSQLINVLKQNKIKVRKINTGASDNLQEFSFDYVDDFKIQLTHLHPNAYSLTQLFGDVNKNGIVNSLIKQAYQKLDNQKVKLHKSQQQQKLNEQVIVHQPFTNIGLVFDSQIGPWIEPLLPLIKSSNTYIQPNGKTVLIEHPLKLIFQCRDLSSVSPSIILATNIVHLDNNSIKWQHMFAQYLRTHFNQEKFRQKLFLDYCESLITFILQPTLEFFKNSVTSFNAKMNTAGRQMKTLSTQENILTELIYKSFLKNESNFIPHIFNLFIALVQSHYDSFKDKQSTDRIVKHQKSVFSSLLSEQTRKIQEISLQTLLDDKNRSVVFNLFIMAITWTVGLMMPEESKKTFSRHFKYLIKRAVQLNIKGIEKDTLPKDEEDIYETCFFNNKWYSWQHVISQTIKKNSLNQTNNPSLVNGNRDSVPMKTKFKYTFLFQKYCQARQPFYLLGKSSTGKNSLMINFLSNLPNQTYNTILQTCTPQSTHKNVKLGLKKQIKKEKYSHAFQGFVNGKCTIFYLCDMNLPMKRNEVSLNQFVNEYVKSQGWYLNSSSQFYRFKNMVFCGTLNSGLGLSEQLIRFINPIPYIECDEDIRLTLFSILQGNDFLNPYGQKIVKLMMNLQEVVHREYRNKNTLKVISYRDLSEIAENMSFKVTDRLFSDIKGSLNSIKNLQMTNSNESIQKINRNKMLQCWIMETEQKYQQVLGKEYEQEKIYYFINNVLMEEERIRYKSILPSNQSFLSNFSYYLSRISLQEKSNSRRSKLTRSFLLPYSHKVYEGLPSIKEDIQTLQTYVDKTSSDIQEKQNNFKKYSFSKEIQLAISAKRDPKSVSSYLKSLQAILDCFLQEKSHLIFLINQNEKLSKIKSKQNIDTTIKQLFDFDHSKEALDKEKQEKNENIQTQLQQLLRFATNVNKSHVVTFEHPQTMNQVQTQWKLFISELFQLINSPLSNDLNDYYVVYIKDIKNSEEFILQEFLALVRTGVLKILQEYIANQDLEAEELLKSSLQSSSKNHQNNFNHDSIIEEDSQELIQSTKSIQQEAQSKRIQEENKRMEEQKKKSAAQLMRQKVLGKIKFVIELNDEKMQTLKQNYSVLFQKCHILWSSHLIPSTHGTSRTISEMKISQKQLGSVNVSKKSLGSQSMRQNSMQIQDTVKQDSNESLVKICYNDHKQRLNQFIGLSEIKEVYLSMMAGAKSKEQLFKIQNQIKSQENVQFLQFLNLQKNIHQGIESIVSRKVKSVNEELQYFVALSQNLLPYLSNLIASQNSLIQSNQKELSLTAQSIQKLSQENQKYLSLFLNSENSISLLEKQFREANELYHQAIRKEQKNFFSSQFLLIDFLKTAKDKKILMTNEMKAYLELFGLVINKKLKPEQTMVKQIVKDIAAVKLNKKITNVMVEVPVGQKLGQKQAIIGQKPLAKLKQFVTKNLMAQVTKYSSLQQEYSYSKDKLKQCPFSENLLNLLKDYFIFFLSYYNKTQEEPVKIIYKKCSKILKQLTKTKEEFQKSQKNKNYQKVTNDLEELKKKRLILLQTYDSENKYLQILLSIQKKTLEFNCLSVNGEIDQNLLAIKSSIETLKNAQPPQRTKNLVIQRIKTSYQKQKDSLNAINNGNDVISLLIACKWKINQSQIQDPDSGLISKILPKQSIETLQLVKLPIWQQFFPQKDKKEQENEKSQKVDILSYFLEDFDLKKALTLLSGIIFISQQHESKLVKKTQARKIIRYSNNINAEHIRSAFQNKEDEKQKGLLTFNKTVFLTDFSSFQEIKEVLQLISQDQNLVNLISSEHKIVIIVDELVNSQIQNLEKQQFYYEFPKMSINFLEFCNKKSQSQTKLINLLQEKLEEELCLDKKQNDNRLLNHWKQLKESQQENLNETKTLIKSFNIFQILNNDPAQQSNKDISNIQKQKPEIALEKENKIKRFYKLQTHLSDLKQIFLEYASINSQLSAIPMTSNMKKKSNIFTNKLMKYLCRVYEGVELLKSQNLILSHYSLERFIYTVNNIIHYQKQQQKGQFNQSKLYKSVKNKLFQLFLIGENHRKLFIGLIFALSGEQSLTEKDFDKIIRTIIRMYFYSLKVLKLDTQIVGNQPKQNLSEDQKQNQAYQIVNKFILNKTSSETEKNQNSKKQLSDTFEQILQQLESSFALFKDLKINIKKKLDSWVTFFLEIQTKFGQSTLQTLPQPYNDINRVFFGIFVALICPNKLQNWLDIHLFEEDLPKVSEVEIMSNQTRILSLATKFNIKQTAIIGNDALNLLTSLVTRTRKQIKLYSKLNLNQKSESVEKDFTSSKPVSRKDLSALPQINFFAERKFSQQIIEELQNCMKNSTWLVIDLNALIKQNQNTAERFNNLDILVKLIDSIMNPKLKSSNQDHQNGNNQQQYQQHSSSSLSQNSLSLPDFTKNDFNPASFSTYDYHIFFIVPQSFKKQIFDQTNLSKNTQRFVMELREENHFSRFFSLNRLYHQEMMSSKKMVKDYEIMNPSIREVICYVFEIVQQGLKNVLVSQFLNSTKNIECTINFDKLKQMVDRLSKIVMIILQDTQILNEIFTPTSRPTMRKIPLPSLVSQQQLESPKTKMQQKGTSRFHRQNAKKKTLKLMLKQSLRPSEQKDQVIQKQRDKIGNRLSSNKSLSSKKNIKESQSPEKKAQKIKQIIKLMSNYLLGSLNQRQSSICALTDILQKYLTTINNNNNNNDNNKQSDSNNQTNEQNNNNINNSSKKRIQKIICNSDYSKMYTTTKSTLEELVQLLNQMMTSEKEGQCKCLKVVMNNKVATKLLVQNSIISQVNQFNNFKLIFERYFEMKKDIMIEQKISNSIQSLIEVKKQLESSIADIKRQLFPLISNEQKPSTQSSSQFNFQSLTQNLTLQEMKKKLNVNEKFSIKSSTQQRKQSSNMLISQQNLIKFILKTYQDTIQQIDKKLQRLKSIKNIFLLGGVNYQLLKEYWLNNMINNSKDILEQTLDIFVNMESLAQVSLVKNLSKVTQFIKEPKHFLISQFPNSNTQLPLFQLDLINGSRHLQQLIHQLKCVFIEANKLKNPNIKNHFKVQLQQIKNSNRIFQNIRIFNKRWYKICSFTNFYIHGLEIDEKNTKKLKQVVFCQDCGQERSIYFNEKLRLVLCFEQIDDEDEGDEGSQSQYEDQQKATTQVGMIKSKQEIRVPFFMQQQQQQQQQQLTIGSSQNSNKIQNKMGEVLLYVSKEQQVSKQERQGFFVFY